MPPRSGHQPAGGIPGVSMPLPAPGAMAIVQDFVNTAANDSQADALASTAAFGFWLSGHGLAPAEVEISEQDRNRALEIREALLALLAAKTRGERDAEAAAHLKRLAGGARCRLRYDDGGPTGFEPAGSTSDGAIGVILAAFVVARATIYWPHFMLCARRGCQRAFYDASRSQTGRWCTKRCGNRARGATYRRSRKHS